MKVGPILMPSLQRLHRESQTSPECRSILQRGVSCIEKMGGIFVVSEEPGAVIYKTSSYKTGETYGVDILIVIVEIAKLIVSLVELLLLRISPMKRRVLTLESHVFQSKAHAHL